MHLNDLPVELLINIFKFLNHSELSKCSLVNKSWSQICNDAALWRELDFSKYFKSASDDFLQFLHPKLKNGALKKIKHFINRYFR